MQFNPGSSAGIVDDIDFICDTDVNVYPLVQKTRNVNRWFDRLVSLILEADGRWQWDDTNWTDSPVATATLVNNQQDYSVFAASPSSGQDYLSITRVEVLDSAGNYNELTPIDWNDIKGQATTEFMETAGMPQYYDKVGASLFLYPKPSTSYVTATAGLKVYFQRNGSYFESTDTTKSPGVPSIFHRYLSLGGALDYCIKKQLPQRDEVRFQIAQMEQDILSFFQKRSKDEVLKIKPATTSSR